MNHLQFKRVCKTRLHNCTFILDRKAEEYVTEEDRLSNFKQAAGLQAISPEQALFGMVAKHMVALGDFCRDATVGKIRDYEYWDEKIMDIINYMILLDALVQERLRHGEEDF